jgi:hypothetical protein
LDSAELLSKLDLIILLSASSLGSGIYNHVPLSSISPQGANTGIVLTRRSTTIFGSDSADYGPKLRSCPERTPLEMGRYEG